MLAQPPFPDAAQLVLDVLVGAGLVAAQDTGTATPTDLQTRTRFVRAVRFGGTDDKLTDEARVDVDWYLPKTAGAYARLRDEAEAGRQALIAGPHRTTTGVIDIVTTTQAPVERPADDERIRRRQAVYTVRARR